MKSFPHLFLRVVISIFPKIADWFPEIETRYEDLRMAHAFSIKLTQLSHTNADSVVSRCFMIHRFWDSSYMFKLQAVKPRLTSGRGIQWPWQVNFNGQNLIKFYDTYHEWNSLINCCVIQFWLIVLKYAI